MKAGYSTGRSALLILLVVVPLACGQHLTSKEQVIFDFETEEELDRMYWRCHSLFGLSKEHVTHGDNALHLQLFPSRYSGFNPRIQRSDWRGFSAFAFDVFNAGEDNLELVVRIDDREDTPEYRDRVNRRIPLAPGRNTVTIPLEGLLVSGKHRKLNTRSIQAVVIFMVSPERKADLYLDHGRLIPVESPQVD